MPIGNVSTFTALSPSISTWPKLCSIPRMRSMRSEEHTSELQSQSNLVCRLLLEKKKETPEARYHRVDALTVPQRLVDVFHRRRRLHDEPLDGAPADSHTPPPRLAVAVRIALCS